MSGFEVWQSGDVTLYRGDCFEVLPTLPDGSVDAIVTDPPYAQKYEHLYGEMAREAARLLRLGGSLVTLCGHQQLIRILPEMGKHLRYRWLINLDQNTGLCARLLMGVLVTWKPMAWFTNGPLRPQRHIVDRAKSIGRQKDFHEWQQSTGYAEWGVKYLTDPGQVVLDPFMGSGTTGVVCVRMGRKFIGVEVDERHFRTAVDRIRAEQAQLMLPNMAQAEAIQSALSG